MSVRRIVFPSTLEARAEAEKQIMDYLDQNGCVNEEEIFSIKLALEESLVNAIRHGNKFDTKKNVMLAYGFEGEDFKLEIEDEGEGFDFDHLPDPTDPANIERPHGRGVMLMRHYMDSISFNEAGNRVILIKKMSRNNMRKVQ